MARITDPRLPTANALLQPLTQALSQYLRQIQVQLNALSDGSISAKTSASNAPPTAGSKQQYSQGDYIENTAPVELGTAGSKYIIQGWRCVAGGIPGTWVQCRSLTGN